MLVRLMYASRATAEAHSEALAAILKVSRAHNPARGITGVLCFCRSSGIFMQVLEGGRSQVNALYNRIAGDTRHREPTLLSYEEIAERSFAAWTMGQVDMDRLNAALLLRYSESATLDPFPVSGQASLALFKELVATASVTGQG
jgi:hypothetical protein